MIRTLLPSSWFYGGVVAARNWMFDSGLRRVRSAGVPVISIGNLTAGGTGKTPLTEFIVARLLARGKRVGILSRGYGRESRGVVVVSDGRTVLADARAGGDEPVQMARKFPQAFVVVGERRVEAALCARERFDVEVLVLDDGFQHRTIARDLNILVVDARKDVTREPLLPAGNRRELLSGIRRADVIVLSRMEPGKPIPAWADGIRHWSTGPIVTCTTRTTEIRRSSDGSLLSLDEARRRRAVAFSGIADNPAFVDGLKTLGIRVGASRSFPDHHRYHAADLGRILKDFRRSNGEILLTTEKDSVRLQSDGEAGGKFVNEHPVYHVQIAIEILEGESELMAALDRCVEGGGK